MRPCYLGIDDGYFDVIFKRERIGRKTVLLGTIVCHSNFENMFLDMATIDGLDATSAAYRIIEKALSLYDVEAVFLDGVTYAGFNIVNPANLFRLTGVPIIVVFRHKLDLEKIRNALQKHFPDHRYRFKVIEEVYSKSSEILLNHLPTTIRVFSIGMSISMAKAITEKLCGIFAEPYPLRIADRIASILGKILFKS